MRKKILKKTLVVGLITAMSLSCFTGCGKKNEESSNSEADVQSNSSVVRESSPESVEEYTNKLDAMGITSSGLDIKVDGVSLVYPFKFSNLGENWKDTAPDDDSCMIFRNEKYPNVEMTTSMLPIEPDEKSTETDTQEILYTPKSLMEEKGTHNLHLLKYEESAEFPEIIVNGIDVSKLNANDEDAINNFIESLPDDFKIDDMRNDSEERRIFFTQYNNDITLDYVLRFFDDGPISSFGLTSYYPENSKGE